MGSAGVPGVLRPLTLQQPGLPAWPLLGLVGRSERGKEAGGEDSVQRSGKHPQCTQHGGQGENRGLKCLPLWTAGRTARPAVQVTRPRLRRARGSALPRPQAHEQPCPQVPRDHLGEAPLLQTVTVGTLAPEHRPGIEEAVTVVRSVVPGKGLARTLLPGRQGLVPGSTDTAR